MQSIATAMPTDATVRLELGVEQPVVITFEYNDGTGSALYMVAPRIQSD